jgi:omega-amidase
LVIRLAELAITGPPDECLGRFTEAAVLEPAPGMAVFPELFTTGYVLDRIPSLSITMGELEAHPLGALAREKRMWLAAGTFAVRTPEGIVNRMPVYSPDGQLAYTTDKVHMFRHMHEDSVFTGGRCGGVFDLEGTAAGAVVCYDLRFPELPRMLALGGSRLMLVPSEWPEPRLDLFRALLVARAAEAQVFVAGCNLGGDHLGVRFRGGGGVSHPSGKLMEWRDVAPGVRDFELDFGHVDEVRSMIDCLSDRRPEAYTGLGH